MHFPATFPNIIYPVRGLCSFPLHRVVKEPNSLNITSVVQGEKVTQGTSGDKGGQCVTVNHSSPLVASKGDCQHRANPPGQIVSPVSDPGQKEEGTSTAHKKH